jgi:SAM-dependent methyltransferase
MGKLVPQGSVAFYCKACENVTGSVLELGAGTGRLTLPLVRAGHEVTAVDTSGHMLEILWRKASAFLSREERARLRVHRSDLFELDLPDRFSAILSPFSAFTALVSEAERRRVYRLVRELLRAGGIWILDVAIPGPEDPPLDAGVEAVECRRLRDDGTMFERSRVVFSDPARRLDIVERRYRILADDGRPLRAFTTTTRVRRWRPEELVRELHRGGFDVLEVTSDFGTSPNADAARTAVYRCRPRR